MARLIDSPTGGPIGPFEQRLVDLLRTRLLADYILLPNFSLRERNGQSHEYDVVVLAPHAVYVVEAKEWYGRVTGDDTEWLLNQAPRKCPMWLVERKCKVLKSALGAMGSRAWFEPLLVVPNGIQNNLGGQWAHNLQAIDGAVTFLQDPSRVRFTHDVRGRHEGMLQLLLGARGKRLRAERKRVGGYELVEILQADEDHVEYRAKRALLDDPTPYRVRVWHLSSYASPEDRERRLTVIRRPTEALARIGRHPNLLQILDFNEVQDDNVFYEVTEWSDFGTLHGYLKNEARDRLTVRDRLEIVSGVASALDTVHSNNLVHRNLCPETILIAFDRQPRLTDFDRAYIESSMTVFPQTEERKRNPAYVAPELRDIRDYDFDTCSDMYSFGVLLYELLTDELPTIEGETTPHAKLKSRPSELRAGIDPRLDDLVIGLLVTKNFRARPTASEAFAVLQEVLGSSKESNVRAGSGADERPVQQFEIGNVIDGKLRIDGLLGKGAFSQVYKVYHFDHQQSYAMKVLTRSDDADIMIDEYRKIGRDLPTHPNIAAVIWMDRLAPPLSTPFILSEFVDGETLEPYCKGEKRLPWTDVRTIGLALLDALAAMHPKIDELEAFRAKMRNKSNAEEEFERFQELQAKVGQGILHRDIKPANILLELPSHTPKLIDFNIASKLADAKGRGGTPRYWAPDRGEPWRVDMDLFSLGVVLYELIVHHHPFGNDNPESGLPTDPRQLRADLHLSEEVVRFLLKAVAPSGLDRFSSAREMQNALQDIQAFHAPAKLRPADGAKYPGLTLTADERDRTNYNPYITRLLTLYSQARRTNAGTRGLDEIAKLTYVETRLDAHLAPQLADGNFRLVIVTGNAGDGKTAFLQKVETLFRDNLKAVVEELPTKNGSRWTHDGISYQSNYDGSQDEGDVSNDAVLAAFLEPFAGATLSGLGSTECRLIAINEGRLLDFLEHGENRERFEGMRQFVYSALSGEVKSPARALLINLNLRSVAAGASESLMERQLQALLKPELWAACNSCSLKDQCPLKFNADTLADQTSGNAVRARVRRLFEVVHLRRRMHVTMRDLRSALSWILLRDHGCEDIARLLAQPDDDRAQALAALYYPEAAAKDAVWNEGRVDDRLVRLLREADVGLVNEPQLDGRLDRNLDSAVPWMTFEARSAYAKEVLQGLWREAPQSAEDADLPILFEKRRARLERWRRWAFFERRDDGWQQQLPYRSLKLLEQVMSATKDGENATAATRLRNQVLDAVSLSEGLRNRDMREKYLALRVSRVRAPTARSFRLFDLDLFELSTPTGGRISDFIEFAPDAVDVQAVPKLGTARMRVSLDLLEMLGLIRSGYRPNLSEIQGLFVNLQMFRNELLSLPFNRILVVSEDEELFVITGESDPSGHISLALSPYQGTLEPGLQP